MRQRRRIGVDRLAGTAPVDDIDDVVVCMRAHGAELVDGAVGN
jgi:hypothetical protein